MLKCGGVAGRSGQGPGEPKQKVVHLTMVVSDDDDFADDPHQIIPTEEVFTVPTFPERILRDSMMGTFYQQR